MFRFRRPRHRRPASVRLSLEPLEERVVPTTTPNDPLYNARPLYGLRITHANDAWDLTTGSSKVVVAVNDSGLDYSHPDLYRNVWLNQREIPRGVRPLLVDVDGDRLITFRDLNDPANQGPGKITDLNGTGYIDGGDVLRPAAAGGWADGEDGDHNGYPDDLSGSRLPSGQREVG